ncbi:MAG: phBC6A51 family helix-turn-helix protein [Eubacteriales bacterium]|nr:phBC6A51 family helix-turn-helix protein [Eubacteriales bacterium]
MAKRPGITPKQIQVIHMMVFEGMNITDIVKKLGMSNRTVYNWFENKTFLHEYNKQLDKYQSSLSSMALKKIAELSQSEREAIALKAAQDIMDRNGRAPVKKQEISTPDIDIKIEPSSKD